MGCRQSLPPSAGGLGRPRGWVSLHWLPLSASLCPWGTRPLGWPPICLSVVRRRAVPCRVQLPHWLLPQLPQCRSMPQGRLMPSRREALPQCPAGANGGAFSFGRLGGILSCSPGGCCPVTAALSLVGLCTAGFGCLRAVMEPCPALPLCPADVCHQTGMACPPTALQDSAVVHCARPNSIAP